jgi:hypothetical protein
VGASEVAIAFLRRAGLNPQNPRTVARRRSIGWW